MFLKALSTPTFVEVSRLRGLPGLWPERTSYITGILSIVSSSAIIVLAKGGTADLTADLETLLMGGTMTIPQAIYSMSQRLYRSGARGETRQRRTTQSDGSLPFTAPAAVVAPNGSTSPSVAAAPACPPTTHTHTRASVHSAAFMLPSVKCTAADPHPPHGISELGGNSEPAHVVRACFVTRLLSASFSDRLLFPPRVLPSLLRWPLPYGRRPLRGLR